MPIWPRKLPLWWWHWAKWLDTGRKGPRPTDAPRLIPPWAWARYLLHGSKPGKPKPQYAGFFTRNGVFLRGPGGESEDIGSADAAGFHWFALNIGDHHPDSWQKIRLRASGYGKPTIPWLRVKPEGETAEGATERVRKLVRTAQQWGSRALIVNVENEGWSDFPPENVAALLKQEGWRGETGCSTVGYPPAWPNWKALGAVGLMQAFMNERADLYPKVCVQRGLECGFVAAFPTFGTYPAKHPWTAASYKALWPGPYSVYVGDNIGADKAWGEWGFP